MALRTASLIRDERRHGHIQPGLLIRNWEAIRLLGTFGGFRSLAPYGVGFALSLGERGVEAGVSKTPRTL